MNYISAKKDVFLSEMVPLEGRALVQVCGNDFRELEWSLKHQDNWATSLQRKVSDGYKLPLL